MYTQVVLLGVRGWEQEKLGVVFVLLQFVLTIFASNANGEGLGILYTSDHLVE